MPGQLFTDAERKRLGGFPDRVSHEDLVTFYTLTGSDRAKVNQCADDAGRLGFALQLGTLRYLGFCPDDLVAAPAEVVRFLADQLKVAPEVLSTYGRRAQTRTDHLLAIQDHLGYRKAGSEEREQLDRWLLDRALEHDRPLLLWQLACERLAADKVVRPGITVLERMIVAARRGAERETMRRLAAVLDEPERALLDGLLIPDRTTDRTALTWLRQGEVATTPTAILSALERRATLIGWGVDRWDLRALHPNRLKFLARLGKRSTNQALQRAPAERRYPILVAFLRQALEETTDEVIDLVAGSLKRGHVTASLLIGKLQASPRRNALTRALQEYGRVAKTLFVLRYLGSEAYRRRIGVQLNKGESLHALRRFLFFAHQGQVRRGQPEDQANQASCLNLVANAVIAWNTVYMAAVIDRLKAKGERIAPEDLVHLSPARYDHINPYGHYQFRVDRWAGKKPLRPIKV